MRKVVLVLVFFLSVIWSCSPYADLDLSDERVYKWERLTYRNDYPISGSTDVLWRKDTVELTNKEVRKFDRLYQRNNHEFRVVFVKIN